MENEKVELCESLIKWLQCLKLNGAHGNARELADGVAMAQALNQIAPEHFTDSWLSKIKTDVGSNWRLKVSNLKKVVEGVFDYYIDVLSLNLSDVAKPDVMRIAEKADRAELSRLLQLILGCAVNCANKQDYITQIMELEESLQRNIMRALQDLEEAWQGTSGCRNSLSIQQFDVKALQEERDGLAQKCHEMERQIAFHIEEKAAMQQEITKLNQMVEKMESPMAIGDDGESMGPVQLGSARYNELRKQLDNVKDELLQAETARDDLKMKSRQQEIEIINLQAKVDELHQASTELSQLKDEIDILREASDKLKIYETQLATYKKKLEDHSDLRKQVKMLEERSAEYLRQNIQHEEDSKKFSGLKGQVELYKKEIQELHMKLDTEMSKSAKIEFELTNMEANLSALQREKENLLIERDTLRETCDELRCTQGSSDSTNTISREIVSPTLKDRIDRLEAENKALREGQGGQTALAQLLDDSNQRTEKLREQLKQANQKILTLTQGQTDESSAKGNLVVQLRQALELNEQRASQIEETQQQVNNLQTKMTQLEATLTAKEQELATSEARYKKCVEKTKEMIKNIDPRLATEVAALDQGKSPIDPEPEIRSSGMSQLEERLMTTAYHRLGVVCHREAIDARLALLSGSGQSFLARQRQPVPRKPAASFKTK
ncbi:protein hook [Lutzomyia longipalpis]|uniref:protein hook n=1 Tax=Lutzomyia longipalpis TaxID=7200 RepID=UPI002483E206|nr:protein hook [Lutzomyia longipalpis]